LEVTIRRSLAGNIGAAALLDVTGVDASRVSLTFWEHRVAAARYCASRAFFREVKDSHHMQIHRFDP
jgi:hypothetical protein